MAIPDGQDAELAQMQRTLADRLLPYDTVRQALLVIARLGEVFDEADPERAQDALGLLLAHAAVLALIEGMAIGPILDLATALRQRGDVQPIRAPGLLASAVMLDRTPANGPRPGHDIVRQALAEALGFAIAKAVDDAEIGHDVEIKDIRALLTNVTSEVVAGKLPRAPRTASALAQLQAEQTAPRDNRPRPVDPEVKAEALEQLQAATDALYADPRIGHPVHIHVFLNGRCECGDTIPEIGKVAPGDLAGLTDFVPQPFGIVEVPPRHAMTMGAADATARTAEEQRLGVSAATVCPHDASPMSEGRDRLLRCQEEHMFSIGQDGQLRELTPHHRPAPVARTGRSFPPPRKP